jgi:hypothetical protein
MPILSTFTGKHADNSDPNEDSDSFHFLPDQDLPYEPPLVNLSEGAHIHLMERRGEENGGWRLTPWGFLYILILLFMKPDISRFETRCVHIFTVLQKGAW